MPLRYEENQGDLTRHVDEFHRRVAVAHGLLRPCGTHHLGWLYLKPTKSRLAEDGRRQRFQAQATFWL